ncbi:MAG: hypothetical protein N3F63_05835 [Thermoplasmata archaeon]|nr:hypothetical protein [Thermoplasmata archaeon]
MQTEIEALIIEILENYGYRVINVSEKLIRAERRGDDILVTYAFVDEVLEEAAWERLSRIRKIVATTKLFINLTQCQEVPDGILRTLKEQGVVLVPRENFEREVGRVKLSKILAKYEGIEPSPETDVEYSAEERFFALKMDRSAIEKEGEKVSGFNYELRYVPHHLFTYTCEIKRNGTGTKIWGILAVDAVNGQIKKWKKMPGIAKMPEYPGSLRAMVLSAEEAEAMATEWILHNESREVSPVEMKIDNILVIEKRIERPDPETIVLNYLGIFHLPIWYVEGSTGIMVVNAAEGTTVDMEFFGMGHQNR